MYFAVNPWNPGLPEQISAVLRLLREQQQERPMHCYALIDGCFDESLLSSSPWRRSVICSLYAGTRLEGMKLAAPHWLRLEETIEKQLVWLKNLVEACAGKPMLSIMASALSADALSAHFKPYLLAETQDSMQWPVRWADTRVQPSLMAVMAPAVRKHFLSPLCAWMSADRQGDMLCWQGDGDPNPRQANFEYWPLDDASFVKLVEEAETDAVLSKIYDVRADLLKNHSPAECHSRVSKSLAIASANGINGAEVRQSFSMLSLSLVKQFSLHPAMSALLVHTKQGAAYLDELNALPDEFWQECAIR